MSTDSPTDPLSDEPSLSIATDEAEENVEAAPREIPSARAWNSNPTNVEKAGDLESRGSRIIVSLILRFLGDEDAATVKYSPCPELLPPIRSPSVSPE